jgi:AcrR family transcriptional regulator
MARTENATGRKRTKILNSAIRLFKGHDIKKVTMDDVANLSNVSKMTIYNYFGDKETLYQYVGESLLDRCHHDLSQQFKSEINLVDKMVRCTSILSNFIAEDNLSLCIRLGDLNDEVKSHLLHFNESTRTIIFDLIREGKSRQLIFTDISDECLYHYIDMGLNYFQHNPEYRQKIMSDPAFRQEFLSFIWENIFIDSSVFPLQMDI